jgi:hypothetical protein
MHNPEAQVFNPACEFHESLKYYEPEVSWQLTASSMQQ